MERRLVADGTDVQFEFRPSRRSWQVVEQTSERFARERSTTRHEPEQPRAGLNFFNELHRFDDVAALQSNEVPASSELNVTLHARAFLREPAKAPMGQRNVVCSSHQPDDQIRVWALTVKAREIYDE